MALSKIARTPTIIFDEIDAGIGGNAADSVGEVLKQLGTETTNILHYTPTSNRS